MNPAAAGGDRRLQAARIVAVAALAAVPLLAEPYYVGLVIRLMAFALFAMSLDLLVGCTGLVSLGHAAFFGLAGYTLALATPADGPADLVPVLAGSVAAAAAAATVIGALSVRTTGVSFIMITLAFAQMLYFLVSENAAFGGSDGLFLLHRPRLVVAGTTVLDLDHRPSLYYLTLAALVGAYALLVTMMQAPFGRVIRAIRVNEGRTRALGIATFRYKLVSFVIAGTLAGIAGFLEAAHGAYVSPALLGWHHSAIALVIVILGGLGTLHGPVLGAFAFGLVEEVVRDHTGVPGLILGGIVVAIVLLRPGGLAGAGRDAAAPRHQPPAAPLLEDEP
jgi:branched-chain amino acid transport system permease protein